MNGIYRSYLYSPPFFLIKKMAIVQTIINHDARLCLKFFYGQLRRLFSPAGNKAPPLILRGLHGLYSGFRTSTLLLFFSVTLFAVHAQSWHIAFFRSSKKSKSQSTRKAKKASGTPTTTTVPDLRQKKNNPKLRYIMRS